MFKSFNTVNECGGKLPGCCYDVPGCCYNVLCCCCPKPQANELGGSDDAQLPLVENNTDYVQPKPEIDTTNYSNGIGQSQAPILGLVKSDHEAVTGQVNEIILEQSSKLDSTNYNNGIGQLQDPILNLVKSDHEAVLGQVNEIILEQSSKLNSTNYNNEIGQLQAPILDLVKSDHEAVLGQVNEIIQIQSSKTDSVKSNNESVSEQSQLELGTVTASNAAESQYKKTGSNIPSSDSNLTGAAHVGGGIKCLPIPDHIDDLVITNNSDPNKVTSAESIFGNMPPETSKTQPPKLNTPKLTNTNIPLNNQIKNIHVDFNRPMSYKTSYPPSEHDSAGYEGDN